MAAKYARDRDWRERRKQQPKDLPARSKWVTRHGEKYLWTGSKSFSEAQRERTLKRNEFWAKQGYGNLKRGSLVLACLMAKWWHPAQLTEFMADLSDE